MYGLDLFSGIGGISVALEPFIEPVAYCEIDPYCQSVLLQNMQKELLSPAPIWDDIRTLPTSELPQIDIIYGGFPCQNISSAGCKDGLDGKQSGLFFEVARLTAALEPELLFLENVPFIRYLGAEQICKTLASLGYDMRWTTTTACASGAAHRRERWWLLAKRISTNSDCERLFQGATKGIQPEGTRSSFFQFARIYSQSQYNPWSGKPPICGIPHGLPHWVDRIKSLGNAVVPLQAYTAFRYLLTLIP